MEYIRDYVLTILKRMMYYIMKQKQINKQKVKIFEEQELREKLKLNKNQIDLILNYQEKFPELLQEKNGFCIDGRKLHKQLEVSKAYSTWIKNQFEKYYG
jgi:hypothetical protein